MDVASASRSLESVCGTLSETVARLTARGMEGGEGALQALEYAQAFAELAGSLECVRQNLAEVWASLESQAPGLKDVLAGT